MAAKNLILFSTHVINKAVISEYKKISCIPDYDCVLMIDNEVVKLEPEYSMPLTESLEEKYLVEKEFFGLKIKCLLFDKKLHDYMQMPDFAKNKSFSHFWAMICWYNADYRYYYASLFFPEYAYYWQFDYDVFMNGKSYQPFFDKYNDRDEDVLITKFRKETRDSSWTWANNTEWIYDDDIQIYGSFFPVCRLSNRAIKFLHERRLYHKKVFEQLEMTDNTIWIFSEAFVPTELCNNGFTGGNIDEPYVRLGEWDLSEDRVFECPDNLLYHPVKGGFKNRINKLKKEIEMLKGA